MIQGIDLKEVIKDTSIRIMGAGGAGNNTIQRLMELGVEGAQSIALNTDAQDLLKVTADYKILIGKDLTHGLGAGSYPPVGEEAAIENMSDIKRALEGSHVVFLTCGLGGGTGTGSLPVVAKIAGDLGILSIGVVTLPFTMEGKVRMENALSGLTKLEKHVDSLIVIPNDKLLELAPDLPINIAFKVADEVIANGIKGIVELVTKPGLVNLDLADLRSVIKKSGVGMIGVAETDSKTQLKDVIHKALNNPLLDVDITGAEGAIINIIGGRSLSLGEANAIVDTLSEKLNPEANIIWGAQILENKDNYLRIMLVVTGIPYSVFKKTSTQVSAAIEDLGIEIIE